VTDLDFVPDPDLTVTTPFAKQANANSSDSIFQSLIIPNTHVVCLPVHMSCSGSIRARITFKTSSWILDFVDNNSSCIEERTGLAFDG
jgi:hypothetical protein